MEREPKRRTLTDQLIGRQILLLASLLLVVGASQYLILRTVLFSSTATTLRDDISVLAPIIHHSLAAHGIAGFNRIAQVLVSRLRAPGVEVVITNALGHVMASSSTLPSAVPPLYDDPYFIWHHRVVVDAVIGNPYYPSGYVWLLASVTPIHHILGRDAELYAFLAFLALILSGWLGSLSVRQTLWPLQQIRESTQRIAAGEFGYVTRIDNAPAELYDLGESINRMAASIQALFAQEKALSEQMRRFVADASHELRTPLTAINGFLDLMSKGELTPEEQERGLKAIRNQGQRMARLVNQLLTLSRIDNAPTSQIHLVRVTLDAWLGELAGDIQRLIQPRTLHMDVQPVEVMADPDRLTEVLFNLLDNIQQYTPPDTNVSIRVTEQGEAAVITIEDTGPGIPADDLPHVFDRFYRGDRARTSRSGGSGLGLSIVKSLVEAQRGTITVEPNTPHGARFILTLPRSMAAQDSRGL